MAENQAGLADLAASEVMERQDDVGYPTEPREFIEFVLARTHHTCNSLTSAWPNVAQVDLLRFLDRSKHTRRGSSTLIRIRARVDEFRTLLLAAYPHPSALPQLVAPERPVQVRDRPRHSFFLPAAQAPFGRQLTIATLSPPRMVATRSTRSFPSKSPLEAPNTRLTPCHPPLPPTSASTPAGRGGLRLVRQGGQGKWNGRPPQLLPPQALRMGGARQRRSGVGDGHRPRHHRPKETQGHRRGGVGCRRARRRTQEQAR